MRIGYPCINLSLSCRPSRTFRLASLSEERLRETVAGNLACLEEIVRWNAEHGLLFLRITSDLVPLASHPQNRFPWDRWFARDFARIGALVRRFEMRISLHPDQFVLLNTPRKEVLRSSLAELEYHLMVLELLGLDNAAKIQIHVGGAYGDKKAAGERFAQRFRSLDRALKKRLVVENDERLFTLSDVLELHEKCGVPVLFDAFHHELNPDGRTVAEAVADAGKTWSGEDGFPMVDYSSPLPQGRKGSHSYVLDEEHFRRFLDDTRPHDFDLMLEVKDKERSALRALAVASADPRLVGPRRSHGGA